MREKEEVLKGYMKYLPRKKSRPQEKVAPEEKSRAGEKKSRQQKKVAPEEKVAPEKKSRARKLEKSRVSRELKYPCLACCIAGMYKNLGLLFAAITVIFILMKIILCDIKRFSGDT